ncbi:MAG: hypothetical protein IKZ09_09405 [Clostridia bacterium]|nr:hypothetical protein [Clostridia bacterium]
MLPFYILFKEISLISSSVSAIMKAKGGVTLNKIGIKRLAILLSVLLTLLIAPFLLTWLKQTWDYHFVYVTEDGISSYVSDCLDDETAVFLAQVTYDDQIVSWWQTGDGATKIHALHFEKNKDKYYLERERHPERNLRGFYEQAFFPGCFAILITDPQCSKFMYILDETLYTVDVEQVPFAYCFPAYPQDLIPCIDG